MSKASNKPAKRPFSKSKPAARVAKPSHLAAAHSNTGKNEPTSKQARILALLRSQHGATIAAIMKEVGWQQHSVRGFLAGVVRKKLKLNLASDKVDGTRLYRIEGDGAAKASRSQPNRRAA